MRQVWQKVFFASAHFLILPLSVIPAMADDNPVVKMRDSCEPASFNAPPPVGPGAASPLCKPGFNGSVSFAKFNAELAKDRKVGSWKFNPDQTQVSAGKRMEVENIGGEVHSFTRVQTFGGGIIPSLNIASGNPVAARECLDPSSFTTFVQSGAKLPDGVTLVQTDRGKVVRFQCCLHPWMRLEVKVQ